MPDSNIKNPTKKINANDEKTAGRQMRQKQNQGYQPGTLATGTANETASLGAAPGGTDTGGAGVSGTGGGGAGMGNAEGLKLNQDQQKTTGRKLRGIERDDRAQRAMQRTGAIMQKYGKGIQKISPKESQMRQTGEQIENLGAKIAGPQAQMVKQQLDTARRIMAKVKEQGIMAGAKEAVKKGLEMGGQLLTGKILNYAWLDVADLFASTLGLSLVYINFHFTAKYIGHSKYFCRFGQEWSLSGSGGKMAGAATKSGGGGGGAGSAVGAGIENKLEEMAYVLLEYAEIIAMLVIDFLIIAALLIIIAVVGAIFGVIAAIGLKLVGVFV